MKKIELLLTRHGETIENQKHILQGQLPGMLSPLGLQQAEQLAFRMKDEPLDLILCSDLARSRDTAEIVAQKKRIPLTATPLLREMDWGIYTGESLADVDWEHLPPSVESIDELYHRASELVDYMKVKYAGKRILAVGHGAFNRAVITRLQGLPPCAMLDLPIMENTEVIRFTLV